MAFVLGITGSVASGKSTVLRLLGALGAHTLSADEVAREVLSRGEPAYAEAVRHFGKRILRPDGEIDRAVLGDVVFGEPDARLAINRITHPRIIAVLEERIAGFRQAHPDRLSVLAVEVPLLFECGLAHIVDEVLVVAAEQGTQISRLTSVGSLSAEQALSRVCAQMPIAEKIRRSNRVIHNDGDLASLEESVRRIWEEILLP